MKLLKILAIISGAAIAAIGVTGGPANAAASAWTAVYLHAMSGNGCASYATFQRLAPITSERCADSAWWYYRDLTRSSGFIVAGDHLEFVDATKTYALGFSGGQIKLETPDANSTYVVYAADAPPVGGHVEEELTIPADNNDFIYPNGAGLPLQLSAGGPFLGNTVDSWMECPLDNPMCST
jgi:hypothetical protein